ncbi:MAG: hypothetical protein H0T46_35015 [Deltaproteobacteria bacterium]|nr:hypothetical protein [Deltaproteobacteria bacterium]
MNIRLARPPNAISAPRFAEDVARWVRRRFDVELDYSVESLAAVDALLEQMRAEHVQLDDRVGETLWCLGCYVGEVFVRNASAEWKDNELPEIARDTGTVWVRCGEAWINPIGKVVKRVALGEGEGLPAFYEAYVRS